MLLKSILRTTLKIKRHVIKKIEKSEEAVIVRLDIRKGWKQYCSKCGTKCHVRDRLKEREWEHLSLWGVPVKLVYSPARVKCPVCGKIRIEAIPWTQGKCRLSKNLLWMLSEFSKLLPWKTVSELFGVHWNTVSTAVREAVKYGLSKREYGEVLYIGVDELSRRKGHVYVTNVYDLKEKRLLWCGEGNSRETLKRFVEEYGDQLKPKIKGICCDMWQPYISMLKECYPDAVLVFDRFHIIQRLLKAVDDVRREEARELKTINPELLKRTRYLWLKNPENLKDEERSRLGYLEKINLKSHRAWLLKEFFREFWNYTSTESAKIFLNKWFWWATHSRLKPMRDFAWMLRRHQDNILSYFQMPITNGVVEGLNNKAKVVSHRSYGFRTASNFITALYHCLGKLPIPGHSLHKFL